MTDLATASPTELCDFLRSEGIQRFYLVHQPETGRILVSHPSLEPLGRLLEEDERDFRGHEGFFAWISPHTGVLQGAAVRLEHDGAKAGVRIARARDAEREDEQPPADSEARRARVLRAPRTLEILDGDGALVETRAVDGETAALLVEQAEHVYFVLRIALGEGDDPVLVGARPGARLRVTVETEEFQWPDFGRGSRRPPGGGGAFGGGGGERARRGRPDFDPPEPVKIRGVWLLAE